ncbi:MAG: DNA-processing protein DprA [Patescibacteria group bacterium]
MQTITFTDSAYPPLLKQIYAPPQKLYVRGNPEILRQANLLAVVGSRRANLYGKQACEMLLPPLVRAGITLVSGLAHGIDSLAHLACVNEKRPTIAVLGSGADDASIYPHSNRKLAREILEYGGAIISEYPPGTSARPGRFPIRNRIIVGLCRAVLVVQAAKKSGSLVTARLTLESNRDLYVVPGPITSQVSSGVNQLMKEGAAPVTEPRDLLEIFGLAPAVSLDIQPSLILTKEQQKILKHVTEEPLHIDKIVQYAKLPPEQVSITLLELEMARYIDNLGNMKYVRKI